MTTKVEPTVEKWEFQLHQRVGQLRQWLNERTDKRLITNEDIYTWLEPESLNLPSVQEAKAEKDREIAVRVESALFYADNDPEILRNHLNNLLASLKQEEGKV